MADQTFTERVRLRNATRRLQHHQTHCFKGPVDLFRVNRVAIVNHESVPLVARRDHPKLLCGPLRCRMRRHVPMYHASRADFEDHEHVEPAEGGRHNNKEISGEHRACVVPTKALHACVPGPRVAVAMALSPHRPRRDSNAQLHQEPRRRSAPHPKSDSRRPWSRLTLAGLLECLLMFPIVQVVGN